MRAGRLSDLVSSLQFRLVMGFALTIALTLAAAGIFISLATGTQVERFESDQAMAQAGRVSEFITNYSIEDRDRTGGGDDLQSMVRQAADISGLRITPSIPRAISSPTPTLLYIKHVKLCDK